MVGKHDRFEQYVALIYGAVDDLTRWLNYHTVRLFYRKPQPYHLPGALL